MDLHIDLGQVIIITVVAAIGFIIKDFKRQLERQQDILFSLIGDVQHIIGHLGIERRKTRREST